MGKRTIPAVPEQTVYDCDGGCGRTGVARSDLDVRAEVADRDYSGGIVYGHDWVLCQRCTSDLRAWLRDRGGSL